VQIVPNVSRAFFHVVGKVARLFVVVVSEIGVEVGVNSNHRLAVDISRWVRSSLARDVELDRLRLIFANNVWKVVVDKSHHCVGKIVRGGYGKRHEAEGCRLEV